MTNPSHEALGCRELASSSARYVVVHEAAVADFDAIEERKQARLLRVMELWCEGQRLSEEQFNGNEGRAKHGNISVLLQAFKTHKIRLYGIDSNIRGYRTFIIVEIDGAKKQNKADPKVLKRAKESAIAMLDALNTVNEDGKNG